MLIPLLPPILTFILKRTMEIFQINYDEETKLLTEEQEKKLQKSGKTLLKKLNVENEYVSLLLCSQNTIQELNREYRNKDKATDVLSWVYEEAEDDFVIPGEEEIDNPWGELAISMVQCQLQADAADWSFETEFYRLLVHGLVHLAGYDHEISEEEEQKMLKVELELLDEIGLGSVYRD